MFKKNIFFFLIIIASALPWFHSYYSYELNRNAIINSYIQGYISPPKGVSSHSAGLRFMVLQESEVAISDSTLVRSRSNIWVDHGEQPNGQGGLDVTNPSDIEASHPFLAEILRATPTGAHYLWWVDKSRIAEGTAGFAAENTMIDIEVVDRVNPLPAPDDVANIPNYATITDDGIGYNLLSPATEGEHPTLEDMVEVHYSGWQTDGTMFDSSVLREKSNTFPLGRLIAGWQKSIPLMRVGEKARIWIPGDMAYDLREDRPHAPKGMLVFDVELISISPQEE